MKIEKEISNGAGVSAGVIPPSEKPDTTHLLDVEGAGKFLGLTTWQMRGLLATGELRCVRVGRKLYMRRATLVRWAETSESKYKVAA